MREEREDSGTLRCGAHRRPPPSVAYGGGSRAHPPVPGSTARQPNAPKSERLPRRTVDPGTSLVLSFAEGAGVTVATTKSASAHLRTFSQ
jgi:hypothetical protein